MNKTSIKVNEVQKCLNVLNRSQNFSFQNNFNFVEVHLYIFDDNDEI